MNPRILIVAMLVVLFTSGAALAAPGEGARPTKEQILEKFDADGDGKLSETEREAARAARKERRAEKGDGEGRRRRRGRRRGRGGDRQFAVSRASR